MNKKHKKFLKEKQLLKKDKSKRVYIDNTLCYQCSVVLDTIFKHIKISKRISVKICKKCDDKIKNLLNRRKSYIKYTFTGGTCSKK